MLVLDAIRQLLQFKGWTTIPEIAKIAEKKQAKVLEIVNANLPFIRRDKKRGRIVGLEGYVSEQTEYFLCNNYYRIEDYYGHKYVWSRNAEFQATHTGNSHHGANGVDACQTWLDEHDFHNLDSAPYIKLDQVWNEADNTEYSINKLLILQRIMPK